MSDQIRFDVELRRASLDRGVLSGHAAVFGQIADVPGHYEQIGRSAFDAVLKDEATDVRALIDHDSSLLLGRQGSGTLRLKTDEDGLAFEVDLPDTSYANDLRELVKRGDLTGASFAFIPGTDAWSKAPDGRQLRTHTSVARLLDVSAVTYPAYSGAGVSLRSLTFEPGDRRRSQLIRARHSARVA